MDPERRKAIQDAILRLADGDRSAMPTLVTHLWPVLLTFAERGLGDPQTAEDVAQEVLFRISSRISEFDRDRDGVSWAFGIATFEILTQRKRIRRRRETFTDTGLAEATEVTVSTEEIAIQAEVQLALVEALGELSPDDLSQLGLDSGHRLGAATSAMRKRRQRALERLRIIWRRIYGES
jgi:RNA polymerase sigma-70 factor (ECF subfamily)